MSLRELQHRSQELDFEERGDLRRCQRYAFCGTVGARGADSPMSPGQTPALSVRDGCGALWSLQVSVQRPQGPGTVFVERALVAAERATQLVMSEVGAIRPDLLGRTLQFGLHCVKDTGPGRPPTTLNGGSFGLSMALAALSLALDQPLPEDLAASAALGPDGSILPVEGLAEKLRTLYAWAPAVRTVLVSVDQELPSVPEGLTLVPVSSLEEAVSRAMHSPDLAALVARHQPDPERSAQALFTAAVQGSRLILSWATVQGVAELTAGQLRGQPSSSRTQALWRARVAQAIAARHRGGTNLALPSPPPGLILPAQLELQLLAHELQHAADRGTTGWKGLAERGSKRAALFTGFAATNHVWGALGRLYASWGRGDEAIHALKHAWTGWCDLLQVSQASHAVCEWLRVLGALNQGAAVDAVVAGPLPQILGDPASTAVSRAFLSLAAGRALLASGRPQRALGWLEPAGQAYPHVEAARLRLRLQIREDTADRQALLNHRDGAQQLILLRLAQGDPSALADLSTDPVEGFEVTRILGFARTQTDTAAAQAVARWWRY